MKKLARHLCGRLLAVAFSGCSDDGETGAPRGVTDTREVGCLSGSLAPCWGVIPSTGWESGVAFRGVNRHQRNCRLGIAVIVR